MSQSERLKWIDTEVRAGRYPNADSVADQFEVSRRVAYKDRQYMMDRMGAPLKTDRSRKGWYYSNPTYSLPQLILSEQDASALRRSLMTAQEYLSQTDAEALCKILARLEVHAPSRPEDRHEHVRGSVHLAAGLSSELANACEQALQNRQRLQLLYHSAHRDSVDERVVQPYDWVNWRGERHMIAFCEWRQEIRQFFPGRVREWRLLPGDAAFVRLPDFDIDAYLARGLELYHGEELVTVVAQFSPYQSQWIRERIYHASQKTEDLPDGGLRLTLEVAGIEEVRRWLLGYGSEVEVLAPESLRRRMAEEAKKMQEIYSSVVE